MTNKQRWVREWPVPPLTHALNPPSTPPFAQVGFATDPTPVCPLTHTLNPPPFAQVESATDPTAFDRLVLAHAHALCAALVDETASEAYLSVLQVRRYVGPI